MQWAAERGLTPLEAAARARECEALSSTGAGALVKFADLITRFRELAARTPVGELLELLVGEIGLLTALGEEGPEGAERIENVRELIAGAHEFDAGLDLARLAGDDDLPPDASPLDLFLQKVTLITDVDRHDPEARAVTLMTLHNAKGLEFPVVFISGLEDGLFPLARAYDEPDELEEERRLFYVGITRAKEKLYLTYARTRRRGAELLSCTPSSFLQPIPEDLLEVRLTPRAERVRRARSGYGRGETRWAPSWGGDSDDDSGSWDGGLVLDYSDAQDVPRFIKGERVRHPQFGSGTIRELTGFGRDLKAVIDFDDVGRKKVIVRYANLQKEL